MYDQDLDFVCQYSDTFVKQILYIDDCYMYCLTEAGPVKASCDDDESVKPISCDHNKIKAALYMFDLSRLIN